MGRSLVGRHWRGELGLTWSLWMPAAVFGLAAAAFQAFRLYVRAAMQPTPALLLTLLAWVIGLGIYVWLCVGLLRAGAAHGPRGGARVVGRLVVAMAALMLVVTPIGAIRAKADLARSFEKILENSPTTAMIRPMGGGALLFDGYIGHGAVNALAKVAGPLPGIRVVHLNGIGGELREARRMRDFIIAKGWDTYTSDICLSGCAIAYLGGVHRTMGRHARIGFHSAAVGPLGGDVESVNAGIAREMVERGVDAAFARKAWIEPHDSMWFPTPDELIRAGMVHAVVEGP